MRHQSTIFKMEEYSIGDNLKIEGAYLTINEYAKLRGVPVQTINEEHSDSFPNRKPYRKSIHLKDEKLVFVSSEKPLYDECDSKIFLLEQLVETGTKREIITNEEYKIRGYWANKEEYCYLTHLSKNQITTQLKNNKIEFGQIYEKIGKEYQFFIPVDKEPFSHNDVEIFLFKKRFFDQQEELEKIKEEHRIYEATKIAQIIAKNPKIKKALENFALLDVEDIKNLSNISKSITKEDLNAFKTFARGYSSFFGNPQED